MSSYLTQYFAEKRVTFEQVTLAGHTATRRDALAFMRQHSRLYDAVVRDLDVRNGDIDVLLRNVAITVIGERHGLHSLGNTFVMPDAAALLEAVDETAGELFVRHRCGDWGSVGRYAETEIDDDVRKLGPLATDAGDKLNKAAVEQGVGRIMSIYAVSNGETIWVITDEERRNTTLLTPNEY